MKSAWVALVCGLVFAIGLGVSGMTQPARVTAFLDFTGQWDPSLLFVMLGAILVYGVGYRWAMKKAKPLFAENFQLPTLRKVDRSLALGAAIFGAGWGLAGFCPGPALASLVSFDRQPLIFVSAMLLGMGLYEVTQRKRNFS